MVRGGALSGGRAPGEAVGLGQGLGGERHHACQGLSCLGVLLNLEAAGVARGERARWAVGAQLLCLLLAVSACFDTGGKGPEGCLIFFFFNLPLEKKILVLSRNKLKKHPRSLFIGTCHKNLNCLSDRI